MAELFDDYVLSHIFECCDDKTAFQVSLACKRFYQICYKLWVDRPMTACVQPSNRNGPFPQKADCQECVFNGKWHSYSDKPALVYADGTQKWFKNGLCHRDDDKPAVVCLDGTQEWWQKGQLHREE